MWELIFDLVTWSMAACRCLLNIPTASWAKQKVHRSSTKAEKNANMFNRSRCVGQYFLQQRQVSQSIYRDILKAKPYLESQNVTEFHCSAVEESWLSLRAEVAATAWWQTKLGGQAKQTKLGGSPSTAGRQSLAANPGLVLSAMKCSLFYKI